MSGRTRAIAGQEEGHVDRRATLFIAASAVLALSALVAPSAEAQACQPVSSGVGKECFVSPTGSDDNPGTFVLPFRTITVGLTVLHGGDVLSLRGGIYVEPMKVTGKHGTRSRPIVIRAHPGERVFVDGTLPEFRTLDSDDWEPVAGDPDDPVAPHPEKYVSRTTVTGFIRGAFHRRCAVHAPDHLLDAPRPARGERDVRGDNVTRRSEAWPRRPGLRRAGSELPDRPASVPVGLHGPGIWVDRNVSTATPSRIHVRLSHTHNQVPGVADYGGEVDPRRLRIAIATETMQTLRVTASSHVRFEGLDIRHGGEVTAFIAVERSS